MPQHSVDVVSYFHSVWRYIWICCIVKRAPKELTRPGRALMFSSAWYPVYDRFEEWRPVRPCEPFSQVMVGAGFEHGSVLLRSNTDRSQHLNHSATLSHVTRVTVYNTLYHLFWCYIQTNTSSFLLQLNRLKHLDDCCHQHPELQTGINELKPRDVHFLFVDDNRKFLFCINPKVACTNWKRTFLAMSGEKMAADLDSEEVHASKDLIRLSSYPVEEIYRKLATYTKYVFVRHPYDRLLSAFRDKFEKKTSNFYSRFLSPYIIRKYRIHSRNLTQQHGSNSVTFEEFVDYVLEKKFDRHWKPFHLNCLPCRDQVRRHRQTRNNGQGFKAGAHQAGCRPHQLSQVQLY